MDTPGGQWLACVDAENEQKLEMHNKFSKLHHGLLLVGLFRFAAKIMEKLHLERILGPLLQMNGVPTNGGIWIIV